VGFCNGSRYKKDVLVWTTAITDCYETKTDKKTHLFKCQEVRRQAVNQLFPHLFLVRAFDSSLADSFDAPSQPFICCKVTAAFTDSLHALLKLRRQVDQEETWYDETAVHLKKKSRGLKLLASFLENKNVGHATHPTHLRNVGCKEGFHQG